MLLGRYWLHFSQAARLCSCPAQCLGARGAPAPVCPPACCRLTTDDAPSPPSLQSMHGSLLGSGCSCMQRAALSQWLFRSWELCMRAPWAAHAARMAGRQIAGRLRAAGRLPGRGCVRAQERAAPGSALYTQAQRQGGARSPAGNTLRRRVAAAVHATWGGGHPPRATKAARQRPT